MVKKKGKKPQDKLLEAIRQLEKRQEALERYAKAISRPVVVRPMSSHAYFRQAGRDPVTLISLLDLREDYKPILEAWRDKLYKRFVVPLRVIVTVGKTAPELEVPLGMVQQRIEEILRGVTLEAVERIAMRVQGGDCHNADVIVADQLAKHFPLVRIDRYVDDTKSTALAVEIIFIGEKLEKPLDYRDEMGDMDC